MGKVKIGDLKKVKIVRKLDGSIFEMIDERLPDPVIVQRGRVEQPEELEKYKSKQHDQ